MYQTKDIIARFGVSPQTVRTYAMEFQRYMSPSANPATGQQRNFNDDDLAVFALIVQMKRQGFTYDSIHAALASGQRADPFQQAEFLNEAEANAARESSSIVALRRELVAQKQLHEEQMRDLRSERDKAVGQAEAYKEQLQAKEMQIDSLNERILALRVKLARLPDPEED